MADVDEPKTVRALVERGDILISTVGPFVRWGAPAVEAAIDAGAHYIDSTGEPAFIRQVFEHYGPQADVAGSGLLTAFGYDWVPGNLAGAFALRDAGPGAVRVDIGYFNLGGGISGGTRASAIGAALEPSFAFRGGRLRSERTSARARGFVVDPDTTRWAMSVGGTEHFALPALYPGLRDVDVLLAAPGLTATRAMPVLSLALAAATRVGPLKNGLQTLVERRIEGSTGGPDAAARARSSSVIIAEAFSASGDMEARTRLEGVNAYTFTGIVIAWAAATVAAGGLRGTGALGPVAAFGLDELATGVAAAGLRRVG